MLLIKVPHRSFFQAATFFMVLCRDWSSC